MIRVSLSPSLPLLLTELGLDGYARLVSRHDSLTNTDLPPVHEGLAGSTVPLPL